MVSVGLERRKEGLVLEALVTAPGVDKNLVLTGYKFSNGRQKVRNCHLPEVTDSYENPVKPKVLLTGDLEPTPLGRVG